MKKNLNFIFYTLIIALPLLFSGCAPVSTTDIYKQGDGNFNFADGEEQAAPPQLNPVESQQELQEELAALEKVGDWSVGDLEESPQSSQSPQAPQDSQSPVATPAAMVYDFPVTRNKQVDFYLDQFQNKQRRHFKRWLSRSTKYLPHILEELKEANLPLDLAYLAMIESGYNPSAYSHAHAAGLWQFIPGTGRNYGLRIDSYVDERRDPEKATKSAIAYLGALYERFGDWQLAVAAYNAGEGKIERGLKKYKATDFWELASHKYLHLETKRYVPKLIAAIIIARDPEKYGFTNIDYNTPPQYDLVKVPSRTALAAVALVSSTTVEKLRKLNNELNKNQAPPTKGSYQLKVPTGSHVRIAANLSRVHPVVTTKYKTHKVAKNDTVSRVSKRYRISRTTLLKANKLRTAKLQPGQHLRIPYRSTKYVLLKKGQTAGDYYASHNGRMIMHELQQGETLSAVSKRYSVPVDMIAQWNDITNMRRIRAGHQLAIYLDKADDSLLVASAIVAEPVKTAGTETIITLSDAKKQKPDAVQALAATDQKQDVEPVHPVSVTVSAPEAVVSLLESKKRQPGSENRIEIVSVLDLEPAVPQADLQTILAGTDVILLSDHKKQKPDVDSGATEAAAISYYKVRSGDSLWLIARKLRVSTRDIKRWNDLHSNKLQPGTKLVIKKS